LISKPFKPMADQSPYYKCARCGDEADALFNVVIEGRAHALCPDCLKGDRAGAERSLEDLDAELDEAMGLMERMSELVDKTRGLEPDIPPGLAQFGVTPLTASRMLASMLKGVKAQRADAVKKMAPADYLAYELKRALRKEDYEAAHAIQQKINELKGSGSAS
jgi:DNA-directed RNA polymerase subunit RPC12/RpoP